MDIDGKKFIFEEFGVSGREEPVRGKIEAYASRLADELIHDVTGSLICVKKGRGKHPKKLMIASHMDTSGFVVTYVDEKGFLRFSVVGEQPEAYLLGKRVVFDNGTVGVIGIEKQEYEKKPTTDRMFIDIGAPGREDALRMAGIGRMCAVFSPPAAGGRTLTGGWVDERIGCFVLLEAMELLQNNPHDLFFVFSAQGEVGMRGAQTSSYRLEPDIGVSIDATVCSDLPEGELTGSCVLGGGAGIKVMDRSVIVPRVLVDHLISLAQKRGIPHQRDIATAGRTGAQAIQLSRGGVLAGGISVPVRYAHTAGAMCALDDVKACVDLTVVFCEEVSSCQQIFR